MDSQIIDSIGKLSIEVVAIIALTYVIYLMAKAVSKLGDSHQMLAQSVQSNENTMKSLSYSVDTINHTNERLIKMVESANSLNGENIRVTKELADSMRSGNCPALKRS